MAGKLTGTSRIVEMDLWDQDAIDLVAPGHLHERGAGAAALDRASMSVDPQKGRATQRQCAMGCIEVGLVATPPRSDLDDPGADVQYR